MTEWMKRAKRAHVVWLVCLLLAVGCSSTRQVPFDDLRVSAAERADVHTVDDFVYTFESVAVRGDSLVGTYYVVEERITEGGAIAYVDAPRETVLPLSKISRVEIKELDYANTALLGAGATLFAIWATSLSDGSNDSSTKTHYGPGDKGGGFR